MHFSDENVEPLQLPCLSTKPATVTDDSIVPLTFKPVITPPFGRWYISLWCNSEHRVLLNSVISVKKPFSTIWASYKIEHLLIK